MLHVPVCMCGPYEPGELNTVDCWERKKREEEEVEMEEDEMNAYVHPGL